MGARGKHGWREGASTRRRAKERMEWWGAEAGKLGGLGATGPPTTGWTGSKGLRRGERKIERKIPAKTRARVLVGHASFLSLLSRECCC